MAREEQRGGFREDTLKAWKHYRETGLYATAAEVDAWLESWGTAREQPAPGCHNKLHHEHPAGCQKAD